MNYLSNYFLTDCFLLIKVTIISEARTIAHTVMVNNIESLLIAKNVVALKCEP